MDVIDVTHDSATIALDEDELAVLASALNEVCNGLRIEGFAGRIGMPWEEVSRLQKRLRDVVRSIDSGEPAAEGDAPRASTGGLG